MKRIAILLAASLPFFAHGAVAAPEHPELPPAETVGRTLKEHPVVRAADLQLQAEEARKEALSAGPHEWTLRLARQRRDVRTVPAQDFAEWNAGVERMFRLPGKAGADEALGEAGVAAARMRQGDALHETGRLFLARWFEWLRRKEALNQWQAQLAVLQKQTKAVVRRMELGDASRMERVQAEAALAQARARLVQAQADEASAQLDFSRRFPGIALPANPAPVEPEPLEGSPESWVEAILAHDHELGLARAEALRARAQATRSDKERLPDPSLGFSVGRERGGEERVAALSLSIALPGAARSATARADGGMAAAAAAQEAAALRKVSSEAEVLAREVGTLRQVWLQARAASQGLNEAADMSERAYALGEGSLADMLLARRNAFDASLSEGMARLDALEKRDRLLLDAHRLWPLDNDEDEGAAKH